MGGARIDAAVSPGDEHWARGADGLRNRRLLRAEGNTDRAHAMGRSPRRALVRRSRDIQARTLGQRPGQATAALYLLSFRRRPADLYRKSIRDDGSHTGIGHGGAALSTLAGARLCTRIAALRHASSEDRSANGPSQPGPSVEWKSAPNR